LDGDASLVNALLVRLLAVLLLAFVVGGAKVLEGDTRSFDLYLLQGAQLLRAGHPWLARIMRDFSGLGSTAVMTLLTVITVGYLALISARVAALLVATSVIMGAVFVEFLKAGFGRAALQVCRSTLELMCARKTMSSSRLPASHCQVCTLANVGA
jgi:undecaprenyl-diphosphatase